MAKINLEWDGRLKVHNFRSSNKVKGDDEELSAYLTMKGLMPKDIYVALTSVDLQNNAWLHTFWGRDDAPAMPSLDVMTFLAEAPEHVVQFKSGIDFTDEACTIRKFKLRPAYGQQFMVEFEIVTHPTTNAQIGKLAHKEGHEIELHIKGCRNPDLFLTDDDDTPPPPEPEPPSGDDA